MSVAELLTDPSDRAADAAALLAEALERHQAGEREDAERLYLKALEIDHREPTALYLYGLLNFEMGRIDAAEFLFRCVLETRPDHAESHVAMANLDLARGRVREAIAGYAMALALQPGHPVAIGNLAAIVGDGTVDAEADIEGAIDVCRAAIALMPQSAPAHAMLGRLLLAAGRPGEALAPLRAAVGAAPEDLAARAALALALVEACEPESALAAAVAALALDAGLYDGWFAKGRALLDLHRPQEAIEALERAEALSPGRAQTQLALGKAFDALDRSVQALAHLQRALELDPDSASIHANLGSLLYRDGALDAAERHCRRALELDPDLSIAHRNLAGILADRGEGEEAHLHRDAAYELHNVLVEHAAHARSRVLVLTTSDSGNVPHRYLLPVDRYTRIDWFIEYAPEDQAAGLPAHDVVFNIIGDPDYADATEAKVAAFLKTCGDRVLNDPAKVARTRRDRLPGLLEGIEGVLAPKAVRLDAEAVASQGLVAAARAAGLSVPLLVRPIGSHGGAGLVLAGAEAELEAAGGHAGEAGAYLTEFIDFATPADGLYRKHRVIFVDRTPYPYHLAIADRWLVHYDTAAMPGDGLRQAEELRFLADPVAALGEEVMAAVAEIGRRLDLDYAGVDFGVLPDGRTLVFEANATMLVHPEPEGELDYKNPYVARITSAFQALIEKR